MNKIIPLMLLISIITFADLDSIIAKNNILKIHILEAEQNPEYIIEQIKAVRSLDNFIKAAEGVTNKNVKEFTYEIDKVERELDNYFRLLRLTYEEN